MKTYIQMLIIRLTLIPLLLVAESLLLYILKFSSVSMSEYGIQLHYIFISFLHLLSDTFYWYVPLLILIVFIEYKFVNKLKTNSRLLFFILAYIALFPALFALSILL